VSTTVLAVADEVSRTLYDAFDPERWQKIDLIVSCGDVPPEYLDFLVTSLDAPLFYVRGNHDGAFAASRYAGTQNVHGRIVRCGAIRIAGFEGSRRYNMGRVQYSDREMKRVLTRMRLHALRVGAPDIIITHAPPEGEHSGDDACHGGFETYNRAIELWRPQVFVHGHMHAYNGAQQPYTLGSTCVVNAYPFKVFEIEPRAVREERIVEKQPERTVRQLFGAHGSHPS
jgi:Icc-related predicted phosphoesterase